MNALDLVKLTALMEHTSGRPEIVIGLLDGPVATTHLDLTAEHICEVPGRPRGTCVQAGSAACGHGTFVAGILNAKRNSPAPAICPDCTLLVCPIFGETLSADERMPNAAPEDVAAAISACVDAGARVINLSAALAPLSSSRQRELEAVLDYAMRRGAIVVVAAGNQGTIGSSAITRHPWVIPVVACDLRGRPIDQSNLGSSIGRRGLSAPGDAIISLGTDGQSVRSSGTSVAAPFVTGTIALLWSEFPAATAAEIKRAITQATMRRRTTIVPPLLDAWIAYETLRHAQARR